MVEVLKRIRVLEGCEPGCMAGDLPLADLLAGNEPVVLRGLVRHWGLVEAGLRSAHDAMDYLRSFYNGRPVGASFGAPQIAGRLFYDEGFGKLNFVSRRVHLDEVFEGIRQHLDDEQPPTFYVGSTLIDSCLPGFRQDNDLPMAAHGFDPPPTIWMGNRTTASAHYDAPNNLACVVVGRRRFTVFPPEQIANLYPGPLDLTPGGQAVSLVDFADPDMEQFPRFREALAAGQAAELHPGDAIFVPSLWWHHVEGLSPFNTLVNYWWSTSPAFIPSPMSALYHALWTIRDRPEREKQAWKSVFDYYVFGPSERAGEHIPENARGVLGPVDDAKARQIRAMLINLLNR